MLRSKKKAWHIYTSPRAPYISWEGGETPPGTHPNHLLGMWGCGWSPRLPPPTCPRFLDDYFGSGCQNAMKHRFNVESIHVSSTNFGEAASCVALAEHLAVSLLDCNQQPITGFRVLESSPFLKSEHKEQHHPTISYPQTSFNILLQRPSPYLTPPSSTPHASSKA